MRLFSLALGPRGPEKVGFGLQGSLIYPTVFLAQSSIIL